MTHLLSLFCLLAFLLGCQVKQQDASGELITGNAPVTNTFTVYKPANGSYKQNSNLTFSLAHPFNVTVSGTPRLMLTIGGSARYADYVSGSGTRTLIFSYIVEATMNDTDGISVANTIDLNGGSLTFSSTIAADINISVGSTAAIKVDTTLPSISSVTFGSQGLYKLGQKINITVNFNEMTSVNGFPQLQINLSGATKNASYVSGSGTASLVFSYTVATGNKDLNGIDLISQSLNGGTIKDAAGNDASFMITPVAMSGIYVHDVPTLINSVTASANKTYLLGETISLTAVFSRAITVSGAPRIALDVGGITKFANYSSGSGTPSLVFVYTVGLGDTDINGIGLSTVVSLNSGTLLDSNTDQVFSLTFTPPSTTLINVDATVPSIISITPPTNGTYVIGQQMNFNVTLSEIVTVTGSPSLDFVVGSTTVNASYISGSGTTNLLFRYIPISGDADVNGISLSIISGVIKDASGNPIDPTLPSVNTSAILIAGIIPSIVSVAAPANATYLVGNNMDFSVVFSAAVTVNVTGGIPSLAFDTTDGAKLATYLSGSGTTTLIFRYTVLNNAYDYNGITVNSPLSLNSGTIQNTNGYTPILTFTPPTTSGVLVDASPAIISSITAPTSRTYGDGEVLNFSVVFNKNVTISGPPRIAMVFGATTVNATYLSGSGSKNIIFRKTIASPDDDSDGIELTSPVSLNGGTIRDSNLISAILTFTPPTTSGIIVDSLAPTISLITPPANGTYTTAQNLNFTVDYSEIVNVSGAPRLTLTIGSTTRYADYLSGSGTSTLVFRHTVISNDLDSNGITLISPLDLNSGTIKDLSLNSSSNLLTSPVLTSVFVDAALPSIASVSAPANGAYLVGAAMNFSVVFSSIVNVSGAPSLAFSTTDGVKAATYFSGSGTNTLVFRYTVLNNVYDYDGITVTSPLVLNSGTIQSPSNYLALLAFTPPITTGVLIDASPALITSVTIPSSRTYGDGELLSFSVNFTKNVIITGTPRLTLNIGGSTLYANYQSGTGTNTVVFRKIIASPEADIDGIGLSSPVALNSGTIKDSSNINATLTFIPPSTAGIIVDSQAPQISTISAPSNGTYITGQHLNFTVDYSEAVAVTGSPRLTLTIGSTTRYANYLSGSGTSTLVFRHTVISNDLDSNGIALISAVDTNGGTILDVSSNTASNSFISPTLSSVFVDAVLPTITSVSAPVNTVYASPSAINFTVNYSKAITVTGTPRIHLSIEGATFYANYLSGSGTSALLFSYSPTASQFDMDGIELLNSNNIDLNSGTLKDTLTNNASVALGSVDLTKVYISYPGLGAWFDVDDETKITTVFSSPNFQTSDFNDKSVNARNATQATAANRPHYLSSGFGIKNKPYLQNNSTDFMSLASNVANIKNVIIIFKTPTTIATAPIFATNTGMLMGTTLSGTGALSFNTAARWKINAGTLSAASTTTSTAGTLVANTCYIASGVYTAAQSPTLQRLGSNTFLGQYAEVMIYNSSVTFTNTELNVIHSYLNTKYGCY